MPKLSLHLDELRVETFDTLPWPAMHARTVHGHQGDSEFTCPPDHKTCGGDSCDSCVTCEPPSCGGNPTCGDFTCEGTCPKDTCIGNTCDGAKSCGGSCDGWTCVSCPLVTCGCGDE